MCWLARRSLSTRCVQGEVKAGNESNDQDCSAATAHTHTTAKISQHSCRRAHIDFGNLQVVTLKTNLLRGFGRLLACIATCLYRAVFVLGPCLWQDLLGHHELPLHWALRVHRSSRPHLPRNYPEPAANLRSSPKGQLSSRAPKAQSRPRRPRCWTLKHEGPSCFRNFAV